MEVTPFIGDLMTKLTTGLCAQNECDNEEAKARTIISSLREELSIFIFIDSDGFVFATLSRDWLYNITADAKDTAMKFEIPSNIQDICDAIFSSKAGMDRFLSMRVKMHVLVRLCAESEKNVSKNFGSIVSETFVDVETCVPARSLVDHVLDRVHGRQRQRE